MRSMFANGFHADVFGQRAGGGGMLGQVRLRGYGYGMGQATTVTAADATALLARLRDAESKSGAIDAYIQAHPNLAVDLGADYATFQAGYSAIGQNAGAETNVSMQLSSPADSYDISGDDYTAALAFAQGADQAYAAIQAHPGYVSPGTVTTPGTVPTYTNPLAPLIPLLPGQKPPVKPTGLPVPAKTSNLTAPLLVGGGVLAIGVIALLARG